MHASPFISECVIFYNIHCHPTFSVVHSVYLIFLFNHIVEAESFHLSSTFFRIYHLRLRLDRFDLVVTPYHGYYALTESGQQEIRGLLRRRITPEHSNNIVSSLLHSKIKKNTTHNTFHCAHENCSYILSEAWNSGIHSRSIASG